MPVNFTLLLVEDNAFDAELILRELKRHGFDPEYVLVENEPDYRLSLKEREWDIVICDYSLPSFNADKAFEILQEISPLTPFILASGVISEEQAIWHMTKGVKDYIQKDKLERLAPVVARELKELELRRKGVRAEAEKLRLATAINQSAEAVVIADTTPIIQYVNPAFEKITGYTLDEAVGQNPGFIKSGKHNKAFYEEIWSQLLSGRTWQGKFINKRKNGELYFEDASISPVQDPGGKTTNFVAVKRDITNEILLERSRDHFTVVTAHELSTPLTELVMVDNLLKQKSYSNPDDNELTGIQQQLSHCLTDFERVVSGVNLLSQLGSTIETRKKLSRTYFYYLLTSAVSNAVNHAKNEGRDVSIELDDSGLPQDTAILANEEMLLKALDEVLSNSIKYTPDGRKVSVKSLVSGSWVTVEIRDEGSGIPHEMQKYILTPFSTAGDSLYYTTGKYKYRGGGMGIGLTIANLVTGYHSGKLNIESPGKDKGTVVTFQFPLLID